MEDEPVTASDYFHRGVDLLAKGEYSEALECLNTAISRNYYGADIALVKGEVLYELGRYDEALEWFDRISQLDGSMVQEATLWRGRTFFEMGQFGRALSALNRVIATAAAPADAYFFKGMVLVERGDPLKALDALAEAKALVGDSSDRLCDLLFWEGRALRVMRRLEEAVAAFEKTLSIEPDYLEAYSELGELYRTQGRLEQACEAYRRGLRQYPNDPEMCTAYGNALRDLGRLTESLEWHNKAVSATGNSPSVTRYNRAVTFERMSRWDEALADYAEVLAHDTNDVEIHIRRLDIFSRLDRFEEAYAEWERVPEASQKQAEAEDKYARLLNRHARSLEAAGRVADAVPLYRKLLELHPDLLELDNPGKQFGSTADRHARLNAGLGTLGPDHPDAALLPLLRAALLPATARKGQVELLLKAAAGGPFPEVAHVLRAKWLMRSDSNFEKALAEVNAALAIRKDYVDALWIRVELLRNAVGDAPAAIETYNEMLKLQPGNPTVLHDLGTLYFQEGEPFSALLCFRAMQDMLPGDVDLQVEIAGCYLELGRIGEAVEELRRLAQQVDSDLDLRFLLIEALLTAGEETEAADMLAEVEQLNGGLDPSVTDSCAELRGALLNRLGRHEQALECLKPVPADELSDLGALNLAIAMQRTGDTKGSRAMFQHLSTGQAANSRYGLRALLELVKIEREDGNFPLALEHAHRAMSLDPYNRVAQALYVWLLRDNGRIDEAESAESIGAAYRELEGGRRLLFTEQFADAAEELKGVVRRLPQFPEAQYLYAAALCRTGQYVAATDALRRAVEFDQSFLQRAKADPFFEDFAFSELTAGQGGTGAGDSPAPDDDDPLAGLEF
jgi:tetratricopeptide (TPR) repeat protein